MAFEEKRAWSMIVVSVIGYIAYVVVILGRLDDTPLSNVAYAGAMLWTIGGAIVVSIVVHIVMAMISPKDADRKDERDRQIYRFGEHVGQSFVVIGAVSAIVLAMAEVDHFWIANAIYLAFVLSALLSSTAKIVAYRKGFHTW